MRGLVIEWWWWLLVAFVVFVTVAAVRDRTGDVVDALDVIVCAVAGLILAPLVWVVTRVDVGVRPLSAKAVENFARMRSADRGHRAWVFFYRGRGVLILRKWDLGSDRVKVELKPEFRGKPRG